MTKIIPTLLVLVVVVYAIYAAEEMIACNKMACPEVCPFNCWRNGGRFFHGDVSSPTSKHCCDVCLYQGFDGAYCNSSVTLENFDPNARGYLAGCWEQQYVCIIRQNKCSPYLN
ncbi:hypothetical protein SAMD00019534_040400, partial [Acytostelium subglobosum LB1]|uniref:hypothetical protein n=1 Tax=Acytostelium subglobosum LB1 TaxID=1410327 RepID=UPI00064502D5